MSPHPDHTIAPVLRDIQAARTLQGIQEIRNRLPSLMNNSLAAGISVHELTGFLSDVADAVLKRLMAWSLRELGPAPVGFAFMLMGSLCRKEMTLNGDQDNAIVYEDVPHELQQSVNAYFLKLGKTVCALLDESGYPLCKGDFMARNPEWCQPLSAWNDYYVQWIQGVDPESQVHFGMFFDFRVAYGEKALADELRARLFRVLGDSRGFLYHLLKIAQQYDVPLGRLGKFKVSKMGRVRDLLDVKSAVEPIVFIVRVLAYQHGIESIHTLGRLEALGEQGILEAHTCRSVIQAYSLLVALRLKNQIDRDNAAIPENFISLSDLTPDDRFLLKEALRTIKGLQGRVCQ